MIFNPLRAAPILYGDGIHDDTEALQWLIDQSASIDGGNFFITKALIFRDGKCKYSRHFSFGPRLKVMTRAIRSTLEVEVHHDF